MRTKHVGIKPNENLFGAVAGIMYVCSKCVSSISLLVMRDNLIRIGNRIPASKLKTDLGSDVQTVEHVRTLTYGIVAMPFVSYNECSKMHRIRRGF